MKLRHAIICNNKTIRNIAIFGNEAIDVSKVQMDAIGDNASEFAKAIIAELRQTWPNGFSKAEFEDANANLCGFAYTITEVDDEHVLMIRTKTEGIEIYLICEDNLYKPTGEYHIASTVSQGAAIEALLQTKGTLALDALTSVLETILDSCPLADMPKLRRILQSAYRASNGSNAKQQFRKYIGKQ